MSGAGELELAGIELDFVDSLPDGLRHVYLRLDEGCRPPLRMRRLLYELDSDRSLLLDPELRPSLEALHARLTAAAARDEFPDLPAKLGSLL